MQKITREQIIDKAVSLLSEGTVSCVLGWKKGEFDYDITPAVFESEEALRKENEMRVNVGQGADQVRVVRAATVPAKPLYPDPALAYSIGAGVVLLVWILLAVLWPSAHLSRTSRHG